jgi:hypothetical protein
MRHVLLIALMMSALAIPGLTTAQEASPEAGTSFMEGFGLPKLEVTVTADGIEMPTEFAPGPALLEVHNQTEGWIVSSITQLPEGVTDEAYAGVLMADAFPEWTAEAVVIGGLDQAPMTTERVIVNLAAGTWSVGFSGDVPIATPVVTLTVTGEPPAGAEAAIPVDLEIGLGAYTFDIPDTVAAKQGIWRLTNSHTVLHHLVVFPADRLYTAEEVHDALMAMFSGTPVADGFSLDAPPVLASSALSEGQSIWIEANLAPGFYVAICFLPDPGSDVPHVMMGMIDTFEAVAE